MAGDELRYRRTRLGMTQEQLAEWLGLSDRQIRRLESGERGTRHGKLIAMALDLYSLLHPELPGIGGDDATNMVAH